MKLNLGCGDNKIPGYVNIDCEKSVKPDRVLNFISSPLPYKNGKIEEVIMFHTIEHIQKVFHNKIFREVARVLQKNGTFILSFPEFSVIAENWLKNKNGKRDWWEKTIFGRQLYPADFHLCAMDSTMLKVQLEDLGFGKIKIYKEKNEQYNSVVKAIRSGGVYDYEQIHAREMKRYKIVK